VAACCRRQGWYCPYVDALLQNRIELARRKSPAEKLAEALELMDWGIAMQRRLLHERHKDASDEEIEARLTAWLCRDD
jgi:hypothetical protein